MAQAVTTTVLEVASPIGRFPSPPVIAFCTAFDNAMTIARS